MKPARHERGQALILIALAAVGLFGFTALAIDGSRKFSDRRHAQNAADAAALAAALASSRGADDPSSITTATDVATTNGYDGLATNDVTVVIVASPAGVCPPNTNGKDITVTIDSVIPTTLARVVRVDQLTNKVSATSRECGSFIGPPFNGNAVVALAPTGRGYDANGNTSWYITGGGIFSNSVDSEAAYCQANATDITVGTVDVVGGHHWGNCDILPPPGIASVTVNDGAPQYTSAQIAAFMPRTPACNGTATPSGGQWHPQSGADGSQVAFNGDMDFAPGLYCVNNSPGPYHGHLTGIGVTFFIMRSDFEIKFNGSNVDFTARAPLTGEYTGVLMFAVPQFDSSGNLIQTQQIDLRGNGNDNITGSIITPSADITMYGNSTSANFDSQIIGYHVQARGSSTVAVKYKINHNYQAALPITLTLLK
jgi:hypothetical protein